MGELPLHSSAPALGTTSDGRRNAVAIAASGGSGAASPGRSAFTRRRDALHEEELGVAVGAILERAEHRIAKLPVKVRGLEAEGIEPDAGATAPPGLAFGLAHELG